MYSTGEIHDERNEAWTHVAVGAMETIEGCNPVFGLSVHMGQCVISNRFMFQLKEKNHDFFHLSRIQVH